VKVSVFSQAVQAKVEKFLTFSHSANMKNKNLNFSPKTLQTSSGSFVAFPYELLNVADVIIMHSVEKNSLD